MISAAVAAPAPAVTDPQDLRQRLRSLVALPDAERLLDPECLSAVIGRPVAADRARIKPESSLCISHRADGAMTGRGDSGPVQPADLGWVLLVASRDKREGILARAAKDGARVREHTTDPLKGPFLLTGGIDSDPRLGREVHRLLRRLGPDETPEVLSYNPGRHLLLALPGSEQVLRVAARPLDDLERIGALWHERALPVLPMRRWKGRSRVLIGARWGRTNLAALPAGPAALAAAREAGDAIGRLHAGPAVAADTRRSGSDTAVPAARIGRMIPRTDVLQQLLPERARGIQELVGDIRAALPYHAPHTLIHGDLSPDQVLVGDAAEQGIRVVDLDRSGRGPAGADLGSWIAACQIGSAEHLVTPFLTAYAHHQPLPPPAALAAWIARALLAAALDPLRRHDPQWFAGVERRLDHARSVLDAATDETLPPLQAALEEHPGAVPVSHRPGRRAVLRVHDSTGQQLFVKVASRGRTERARRALERAVAFESGFRTPQVVRAEPESLTFSALSGQPLHEGLPTDDGQWERAWEATADAWVRSVLASRSTLPEGTVHGPEEETGVLRTWQRRAEAADPDGAAVRASAIERASAQLASLPRSPDLVLIHRDLHDKQILWDPAVGPGLLDVDTCCLGDPALDAGNLRAHATWRRRQGLWTATQTAQAHIAIDRATTELGIPRESLMVYENATLTRLTCVYALRPRWREAALDLARALRA
ncbi:MAG: phosphotransferase [Brachybacterium sp.]|nr:phosphotransferase [Brachybacterium sp.]